MKEKLIYSTGIGLQLRKVGILEMTGQPNILMLDLGKLIGLTMQR